MNSHYLARKHIYEKELPLVPEALWPVLIVNGDIPALLTLATGKKNQTNPGVVRGVVVLAQVKVDEKTNEIHKLPELLDTRCLCKAQL